MKATLHFNMDDAEDRQRFDDTVNGPDYKYLLQDLDNMLRHKLKYEELPEGQYEAYEHVREELGRLLDDRKLPLWD